MKQHRAEELSEIHAGEELSEACRVKQEEAREMVKLKNERKLKR